MDARTQKKIHILGPNDYGPFLAKHVPPHHLLPEYGGTSQERLEDDVGPWPPAPVHLDPPAAAAAPPHLQDWPASASAAGNGRRGNSGGTELDTFSSSVGSGGPAVAAAAAAASSATNSNGFARLQAHQHHHHPNGALLPPVHSLPQLPTSSSASIGRPGATAAPFAASLISFDDEVTARKGPLAGVAEERSSAGTATSGGGGGGGFSHQRTLSLGSIADNASVSNEDDGASSTSTGQGGNPPLDRLSFYTATSGDHNHSQSQISADLVGLQLSGGGGGSSPGPGDFGEVSMDGAAAVCCMPGLKLRQRRRNQPGWVELGESIREEDPNEFGSSSGLGGGALGQDVESGAQRLLGRRSSGGHGSGPAAGAKGGRRGSDGGGGNGGASGQQQRHVRRVNKVPSAQQLLAVGDAEPVDPEDDFFDDARRMYSRSRRRSKLAETFCCAVM